MNDKNYMKCLEGSDLSDDEHEIDDIIDVVKGSIAEKKEFEKTGAHNFVKGDEGK